jgi:hypothetical protein
MPMRTIVSTYESYIEATIARRIVSRFVSGVEMASPAAVFRSVSNLNRDHGAAPGRREIACR